MITTLTITSFYTETAEIVSNLALGILEDFMEHVLASVNDK